MATTLESSWAALGQPGPGWAASERLGLTEAARGSDGGASGSGLDDHTIRLAKLIAQRPAMLRRSDVERYVDTGRTVEQYVEAVAVVSRSVAVDTFLRGIGLPLEPLPQPRDGEPTGHVDDRAGRTPAWVPMVGGASITQALSLLPTENAELERLHGALYLTFDEMAHPEPGKALSRPQMELVAARTSVINECFY